MKHKFPILIFAIFLMLLAGSVEQVLACSCSSPTICQAYNFADYIFVGKIVKKENDILTFEVEEGFFGINKGELIDTIQGNDAGNCTFKFDLKEKYLVYGFEPPDNSRLKKISKKSFGTYRCFRTQILNQNADDLKFLRKLPTQNIGGKIFGKIYRTEWNENRDLEEIAFVDIPVIIKETESNLPEKNLRTNRSEEFEITVPVGIYEVKTNLPEGFKLSNDYQEPFGIRNAGCANKSFILEKVKK